MKPKKFGIFLLIVGIGLLGVSYYITTQVEEGKIQISSAEKKVSGGKKALSIIPNSQPIGEIFSSSAEKKIAAGKEEVSLYEDRAFLLKIAGGALIVIGAGMIFFKKKRG